ncbi:tetratricopeptide repeat protein [Castellaniella sp.]|uniref:tetratricopeptide repeat protein n=1 Tax=Castellaniella sp. TaxID=1955812 RepID=UPI002AFF8B28|nr:tetratricopeptide repeat protein [Castellaniella sp.]
MPTTASPATQQSAALTGASLLNKHSIDQLPPERLAVRLTRLLAGPPGPAAAALHRAAQGGVVQAQLVYGQWLLDGRGVTRNPNQAVQWFAYAARHGEPMALNMLGQCHAHGWGVDRNPLMAAYWFRLAALGSLDWGMYNYATALALGQGVETDHPAALGWFEKAAALGHAKSMNMVGSFHEDGWAVTQNQDIALQWYRQAAEGGDFRGQFNTARLLLERGEAQAALSWLAHVPDTATPAFLRQAAHWLQSSLNHPTSIPAAVQAPLAALIRQYHDKAVLHHADHPA